MVPTHKASCYNQFIPLQDGRRLAFNATACGLATMDEATYRRYTALLNDDAVTEEDKQLVAQLKQGGFLVPAGLEELDKIKSLHFQQRFDARGLGLTIAPTMECNFACDYCYEAKRLPDGAGKKMSPEVQTAILQMVKERVVEGTGLQLVWYGGEPLLYFDIVKSLTTQLRDYCREKQAHFMPGIVTNGFLLTPARQAELIACGITNAQVTLDGPEAIHNRRRPLRGGGPTYQRILDNLVQTPKELLISLRVNVDKRNRPFIPELLADLVQRGIHQKGNIRIYYAAVQAVGAASVCQDVSGNCFSIEEFAQMEREIFFETLEAGLRILHYPQQLFANCGALSSRSYVIDHTGALHKCWNTVGDSSKAVGHLLRPRSEEEDVNLSKWLAWTPFRDACNTCQVLPICMRGCAYREIYPNSVAPVWQEQCSYWKYNLDEMLTAFYQAKTDPDLGHLVMVNRLSEAERK